MISIPESSLRSSSGTLILVVVAVGVATETFGFKLFGLELRRRVAATALAFGLVLVALVYAIGPISGCHINPAVTLGLHRLGAHEAGRGRRLHRGPGRRRHRRRLPPLLDVHHVAALHKSVQGLGTDGYGKESHLFVSQWGAFLIEVVLTAIFVTVVLFATHKAAIQGAAGVAIGFGLVIVHLIGIPLTGTSVNPARSLGPALVVGGTALSQVWVFLVAPLVGAHRGGRHPPGAGRPHQGRESWWSALKSAEPRLDVAVRQARYGRIMDLTEALAFARDRKQGVLATIRANGRPQLSNIMYVPDEGDTFLISITDDRAKTANLRRDPRASLYVLGDNFFQYVVIEAAAELSPVAADRNDATVEALIRYYEAASGAHPDWDEYAAAMVADKRLDPHAAARAGLRDPCRLSVQRPRAVRRCGSGGRSRPGRRRGGGRTAVERLLDQLGEVEHADVVLLGVGPHGVVEHDHAVGAGRRDDVGPGAERLVHALHVDPLADVLLEPHAGAAGTAAEAALLAAPHLDLLHAGNGAEHRAGLVDDPVVPARGSRGRGR